MGLIAARTTLVGAVALSALTIWAVHYQQYQEHQDMYQGVLRDDIRRKEKLRQRQEDLEVSQKKRELYEQFQKVEKAS